MRAVERLVVVLLAAALLAAGLVGLVEIGLAAADRPPWLLPRGAWATGVRDLDGWSDGSLRLPAIALVVAGAALVALALWPRRPELLLLGGAVEDHQDQVTRRGMEALIEESILADVEVRTASVKVGRRQVAATVSAVADSEPGAVRGRVTELVRRRLADTGVLGQREIVVDVTATPTRVR